MPDREIPDREIEVAVHALDPVAFARERLGFTADPVQARVLQPHMRRGLLNCTRQWSKSTVTAIKALHQAWFEPESLTLVVSPSARQSAEFLRKVEGFLKQLRVRVKGDGDNAISVALPNGSRIVGLPGNEDTIRGFSAVRLLLIDEAARVPDDLYRAVRPMLAASRGSLWLMSTPHGQRGFFYDEWSAGDGDEWLRIRVPATGCPRIAPEVLIEERRTLGDRWFRQEYFVRVHRVRRGGLLAGIDRGGAAVRSAAVVSVVAGHARPLHGARCGASRNVAVAGVVAGHARPVRARR